MNQECTRAHAATPLRRMGEAEQLRLMSRKWIPATHALSPLLTLAEDEDAQPG
jgi:hypothetical protein